MTRYEQLQQSLRDNPRTWLVTGIAGFIGSHLGCRLLSLGQKVVGLDNYATGSRDNVDAVRDVLRMASAKNFTFVRGDIRELVDCKRAAEGVDYVLHQAALGSVPRSLNDPLTTNGANIDGFLNMLVAARDAGVKRFVYAASSSTYGDHEGLPKVEDTVGQPLSPYAVTKYVNELYADVFDRAYGMQSIGLRYFNVFGPRQDPAGAYAAVIPRWFGQLLRGEACRINGDGETSRDFCYVDNVVQANLLAATVEDSVAVNEVYNVAVGGRTTLNALYEGIRDRLAVAQPELAAARPSHCEFRGGDVRHSQADISKAQRLLGYTPTHDVEAGLTVTADWFLARHAKAMPATKPVNTAAAPDNDNATTMEAKQ